MQKVDIIIWSKDRPAQLDLLLRSIKKYFHHARDIHIVHKSFNENYKNGYELLKHKKNEKTLWYSQTLFENDIKNVLANMESDYILGISDDCIFIDDVNFPFEINGKMLAEDEVAVSLRLGKDINYCQPAKLPLETPAFQFYGDYLYKWDWTKSDPRGCFGYPHPVDSNIYDRHYITNLLNKGHYENPCEMENFINTNRPTDKPYMICFRNPKLISISANSNFGNVNSGITTEDLNKLWLEGYQIKMPDIIPGELRSAHIDYYYQMEARNA